MSLSNTYENRTLTWLLTNSSATRPTAWYIALFTSNPDEDASGTEVSGGSYAREAATFTVTGNAATTSAAIEWAAATANWGTITHAAIFDASTSGNMIAYAQLTTPKTIETGDVFRIPAGDFDVTLD